MKQGEGKEIQVEALLTLVVKDYNPDTINSAIITPTSLTPPACFSIPHFIIIHLHVYN